MATLSTASSLDVLVQIRVLMSSEKEDTTSTSSSCCASCGIADDDEIKLMACTTCDLVQYCGDESLKEHQSQHEETCNKKRAAELRRLREELLFKQPESSHLGDCLICCLPLSLDVAKYSMQYCCSKLICNGCDYANLMRMKEGKLKYTCAFCREPTPFSKERRDEYRMKRIETNDPVAMYEEGVDQYEKGDYSSAFEYCAKAAELGDVKAHFRLAVMYDNGFGVEKDMGKNIHHMEEAAIGGYPEARYNLGCHEWKENNNAEKAVKHWIISAGQGYDLSIEALMDAFKEGCVVKEELAAALRAHQAAVDATKSPQREAVESLLSKYRRAARDVLRRAGGRGYKIFDGNSKK